MGKVTIRCPNCKQSLVVTRPDSLHENWSFEKPLETDTVEQVYECKNPNCNSKFTVYWYENQMLLERV